MKGAIKVFVIIGMIFNCWWIFPIFSGIGIIRKLGNNVKIGTGSKVGVLFYSPIAGILLLSNPTLYFFT